MPPKDTAAQKSKKLPELAELKSKRALRINLALGILGILWPAIVLIINPGWLTFFLFTPLGWLMFVPPFLVLLAVKRLGKQIFLFPVKHLRIIFYATWFLAGVFFTNFGDTKESVTSIFTRVGAGLGSHDTLVAVSGAIFTILICAALLASLIIGFYPRSPRTSKPLDN